MNTKIVLSSSQILKNPVARIKSIELPEDRANFILRNDGEIGGMRGIGGIREMAEIGGMKLDFF